jgi:two-component system, sensor histidine kinase and response regulator
MTRSISHEIRTPLNTAFMGLDLLLATLRSSTMRSSESIRAETAKCQEISESVREGCSIALNILNQLLTFEKLSAGMLQLESKLLSVSELLDSNMKLFRMQAQQAGISFKLDTGNVKMDQVQVFVDEHKMNQVLRNLLSNAMKFTPKGGTVEVRLQWLQEGDRTRSRVSVTATQPVASVDDSYVQKGSLFISVVDSGPGVSQVHSD